MSEWIYVLDPVEVRDIVDTTRIVGTLQAGMWYALTSDDGTWARVADSAGGLEGWVPAAAVHRRSHAPPSTPQSNPSAPQHSVAPMWTPSYTVPASGLQAWAQPDPSQPAVTTLAGDVGLEVVERRADWARVRAQNGWEGWIDGRRLLDSTPPTASAPVPHQPAKATPVVETPDGQKSWGGSVDLRAFTDGTTTLEMVKANGVRLAAAASILIATLLPWTGSGGNAFDIPVSFLITQGVNWSVLSVGILTLLLAVASGVVSLVGTPRHRQIAGGLAIGIGSLFLLQYFRLILDFSSDLFNAVANYQSNGFGIAPWLVIAAGVTLIVRR